VVTPGAPLAAVSAIRLMRSPRTSLRTAPGPAGYS